MNCQEALDLLYDIIDKEASEIDTRQVKEHLEHCHDCFKKYELEGAVQEFINAKLAGAKSAPCLDHLKSKIVGRLDKIDQEKGGAHKKPPFWNASFTLAAAAFVVITIGAAFLLADFYRHNQLYVPLERAHWDGTRQPAQFGDAAITSSVLSYVTDTLKYTVDPKVMNYSLIGAHMENLFGVRMAHLMYKSPNGADFVSVFLAPADQMSIPTNLESTRLVHNSLAFFDHNCRGCRLMYHHEGTLTLVAASTDHQTDLMDFLPGKPVFLKPAI
jgi:anti-sigma factor (TIGR02949 family)